MIVSFKHNFVFIKTQKTAGTSIEIALSPYCGPDDILTPIASQDERLRLIDGEVQARNYAAAGTAIEAAYRKAFANNDTQALGDIMRIVSGGTRHFYNHMSGREARARLPAAFWQSALKFTIVRHPYERAVSFAYFNAGPLPPSADRLSALIDRYLPIVASDLSRYTSDGALIVDDVIRHGSIREDLDRILGKLGLAPVKELPRAKAGYRLDRRPARDVLSDRQKKILQETCRLEFELFGYEP